MFNVVLAYGADQKSLNAFGKRKLITPSNTRLHSLLVVNKGETDFWVQVYDVTGASESAADTAADLADPVFEVPCFAGSFVPFAFAGGWPFGRGCYVRCVTIAGGDGGNLIAADDAKITAAFMDGPLS